MDKSHNQKKLLTFEPLSQISSEGFLCTRQGSLTYPPFYNLALTSTLTQSWDTQPNDIFVCTHQKVGTHLTKKYVVEILRTTHPLPVLHPMANGDIGHGAVPWPEVLISQHGEDAFRDFIASTENTPRVWYLHNYSNALPFRSIHPDSKFIYTFRDPRGAAVSQYFFYCGHPNLEVNPQLSIDNFLSLFLNGKLYFGDYHQHVLDWLNGCHGAIASKQLLCMRFEDLVTDKINSVQKIAAFLFPHIALDEHMTMAISNTTEFETMKQSLTHTPGSFHFNPSTFFRAGTTDDWKQHLNARQQETIDAKTRSCWGGQDLSCPQLYFEQQSL
ncbi:MAG: sulfotransferase domain-containing protein [Saprospiraceae bacterium]|jgi:hypothetical protein|nr:sulfotransferase domain-containing protein [Saprospiraceae bacterium]